MIVALIRQWGLFNFEDEDKRPYPSTQENGGIEPRWVTLVAWARKDCVSASPPWMQDLDRNRWKISPQGNEIIVRLKDRCAKEELDVRHGYLWSPKFKKILSQGYEPSDADAPRPPYSIYDDTRQEFYTKQFESFLENVKFK